MLETMAELSKVLKKRREKRGSINFELPEQKVILDEKKHPIEIKQRIRSIAEMMIEEFMLAANETVAAHMAKRNGLLSTGCTMCRTGTRLRTWPS